MANTYTLISSNTLGSDTATVTFSSIPGTYTDLVLKGSARLSAAGVAFDTPFVRYNNNSSSIYSQIILRGTGSAAQSANSGANATRLELGNIPAATATANTFGSFEIYIPSYTASQNKPTSFFTAQENNNSTSYIQSIANLFRSTSAITEINLYNSAGVNFVTGSSFYLYGIKNS